MRPLDVETHLTLARLRHSTARVIEDLGKMDMAFDWYDRALKERMAPGTQMADRPPRAP